MQSALSHQPQLETPVIFTIFNRPETTKQVWDCIRKARPKKLYIVADAPRPEKLTDAEKVAATRKIVEIVDWPCEVIRDYAKINEGEFLRVHTALELAFKKENEIIWLEDDCLPSPSFFTFCEAMLKRYADNEQIAYINGSNLNWGLPKIKSDYYVSRYMFPWGYALWKRSWELFRPTLEYWMDPSYRATVLNNFTDIAPHDALSQFEAISEKTFWTNLFDSWYNQYEKPGTNIRKSGFDYYIKLALWAHQKRAIMPRVSLVKNIGFGAEATHTQTVNKSHIVPLKTLDVANLKHPASLAINEPADNWTFRVYALYEEARPWKRLFNKTKIMLGKIRQSLFHTLKNKHEAPSL